MTEIKSITNAIIDDYNNAIINQEFIINIDDNIKKLIQLYPIFYGIIESLYLNEVIKKEPIEESIDSFLRLHADDHIKQLYSCFINNKLPNNDLLKESDALIGKCIGKRNYYIIAFWENSLLWLNYLQHIKIKYNVFRIKTAFIIDLFNIESYLSIKWIIQNRKYPLKISCKHIIYMSENTILHIIKCLFDQTYLT